MDVVYIVAMGVFVALGWALVIGCVKLGGAQ